MKKKQLISIRLSFFLLLFVATSLKMKAQDVPISPPPSTTINETIKSPYCKIAIGLNTGTKGNGIDVAMTLNRYFNVRLGFTRSKFLYSNDAFKLPAFLFDGDSDLKNQKFQFDLEYLQSNFELLGEYKPFGSAFRIVGGLAYFPKNIIKTSAIATETYYFNDVPLDPEEIGSVALTFGYKSNFAPYLGLGFGRAVPKRTRFGVSLDLGTYYKGSPEIGIAATAALRENVKNEPILEANLSKVRAVKFFPVASLRFAFRIN